MKSFATLHNDPDAPLSWRERIGYGLGSFGIFLFVPVFTSYVTMYMTDVAMLEIKMVTLIFGISRLLDGVTDIIAGILVDKTRHPMGKARTWILRATPGIFISMILLFNIPSFLPVNLKYVYLFIFYNLSSSVFLTMGLVCETSLFPLMTRNPKEQTLLGNIQGISDHIGTFVFSLFFMRLMAFFNGDNKSQFSQRAVSLTITIFAAAGCALMLFALLFVKERVSSAVVKNKEDNSNKEVILQNIQKLLKNKNWLLLVAASIVFNIGMVMNIMSTMYYSTYILGDVETFNTINGAFSLSQLVGSVVLLFILPRLKGRKILYICLNAVSGISILGAYYFYSDLRGVVLCIIVRGFVIGMIMAMNLIMTADVIRYTAYNDRVNVSGICSAGSAFVTKAGMGIGTFVFGVLMSAAGYDPNTIEIMTGQAASVHSTIVSVFALWPAVISVMVCVLMMFYNQDKKLKKYEGGRQ